MCTPRRHQPDGFRCEAPARLGEAEASDQTREGDASDRTEGIPRASGDGAATLRQELRPGDSGGGRVEANHTGQPRTHQGRRARAAARRQLRRWTREAYGELCEARFGQERRGNEDGTARARALRRRLLRRLRAEARRLARRRLAGWWAARGQDRTAAVGVGRVGWGRGQMPDEVLGEARGVRSKRAREAESDGAAKHLPPEVAEALGEGSIVPIEVTGRTTGGYFLLRPDEALTSCLAGVIGRAQAMTGSHIFALHALSNHLSLVVGVRSCDQLADFTHRVFGQTGRRVKALRGVAFKVWHRRNRAIVICPKDADQISRMRYNLANGVKEHLVAHATQWPGLHSAHDLVDGRPLEGEWFDSTAWHAARKRDRDARREDFERTYRVVHSKLPCLNHLSDAEYRAQIQAWCDEDAAEAAAEREAEGLPAPPPPEALREVSILEHPADFKPTRAPLVHALDPEDRKAFRESYQAALEGHQAERARERAACRAAHFDPLRQGLEPAGWTRRRPPAGVHAPP
jgi:hypothetical protein